MKPFWYLQLKKQKQTNVLEKKCMVISIQLIFSNLNSEATFGPKKQVGI